MKTPVSIARDALDFRKLIRAGETVGWAEATAEPLLLTRLLDAQAERCSPFRVFFPLTFSDSLAAGHPNVTVTALGGAGAGRRFFAGGADNVVPANISDVPGLVASGWLPGVKGNGGLTVAAANHQRVSKIDARRTHPNAHLMRLQLRALRLFEPQRRPAVN